LLQDSYYNNPPQRGPDGRYKPVEQVLPLEEHLIGGFRTTTPQPPALPPKEHRYRHNLNFDKSDGISTSQPIPRWQDPAIPTADKKTITLSQLTRMSAVERSEALKLPRMHPHLQFMVGPLLRYDTVDEQGIWNGAALVVSVYPFNFSFPTTMNTVITAADSGSVYEPLPFISYQWDPDFLPTLRRVHENSADLGVHPVDLGLHPADPHSTTAPTLPNGTLANGYAEKGPNTRSKKVSGTEIWVYGGNGGSALVHKAQDSHLNCI
jgi:hypothetical protein